MTFPGVARAFIQSVGNDLEPSLGLQFGSTAAARAYGLPSGRGPQWQISHRGGRLRLGDKPAHRGEDQRKATQERKAQASRLAEIVPELTAVLSLSSRTPSKPAEIEPVFVTVFRSSPKMP